MGAPHLGGPPLRIYRTLTLAYTRTPSPQSRLRRPLSATNSGQYRLARRPWQPSRSASELHIILRKELSSSIRASCMLCWPNSAHMPVHAQKLACPGQRDRHQLPP